MTSSATLLWADNYITPQGVQATNFLYLTLISTVRNERASSHLSSEPSFGLDRSNGVITLLHALSGTHNILVKGSNVRIYTKIIDRQENMNGNKRVEISINSLVALHFRLSLA